MTPIILLIFEERAMLGVISKFGGDWWRVRNRDTKASSGNRQALPGGDRSLPDGQAPGTTVLLSLCVQVPRQARFRVDPDGHRQPILRAFVWFGGRDGASWDAGRVPSMQQMAQMERARAGLFMLEFEGIRELLCAASVTSWKTTMKSVLKGRRGDRHPVVDAMSEYHL